MTSLKDFDSSKYQLGSLCKRGHDCNNTGCSLRRKKCGTCLECEYPGRLKKLITIKTVVRPSPEQRFWGRVKKGSSSECWTWMGSRSPKGYGMVTFRGKVSRAHRVAFMLDAEQDIQGLSICHHCDNPLCCNPKHLFLGTNLDNVQDKVAKGRQMRGVKSGNAKHLLLPRYPNLAAGQCMPELKHRHGRRIPPRVFSSRLYSLAKSSLR